MIEGLMNVITPKPHGAHSEESDATLEKVALAGTAAIQQLIADRDQLRKRANEQQRELVTLSAINEELRRRIALIRHHYVELGTRILAQLDQFDQAFRDVMRDQEAPSASSEHANLVALAQRLKPNNGTSKFAEPRD